MTDKLPVQQTETWLFHLEMASASALQLHITSFEQGEQKSLRIDGHDISTLLDYLYEHRELIYEATHDQERRRIEAREALESMLAAERNRQPVEPIFYFDDGEQRTRAS